MSDKYPEEGDKCLSKDCNGTFEIGKVEGCDCHINPPCGACTDQEITCSVCGNTVDEYD